MSTSMTAKNPQKTATQEMDALVARFQSAEHKRVALRKALLSHPDDERLLHEMKRLTGIEYIQKAVSAGIYLSYTRADELFALDLSDRLCALEMSAWLDMLDVQDDRDWFTEVNAALTRCGLMIAILSPEALRDDNLMTERQRFEQNGKLILPVLHEPCDWRRFEFWLPMVDFTHDFERGLASLLSILKGSPRLASIA